MDTPAFILAREEIRKRMEARHTPGSLFSDHPVWAVLWPVLKWIGPMLLSAGFERTLRGLAGSLGLDRFVAKIFLRR